MFPYSYDRLKDYTPKALSFKEGENIDWDYIKTTLPKFFIKDFVKSVKGFDFPTFFDGNYNDKDLDNYLLKFKDLRGELFTEGYCFKEFVDLDKTDNKTHEFRAFFLNGKLINVYANSDNFKDEIPLEYINSLPDLDSDFYTVDVARLEDRKYIVIETGDGQVSGCEVVEFAKELYNGFI